MTKPGLRSALFGLSATAIAGLLNLLVQLIVAATVSTEDFARFAIAATTLLFALALGRACIGQVDMIRGHQERHRGAFDAAVIFSGLAVVLGGAVLLVVSLLETSSSGIAHIIQFIQWVGFALVASPSMLLQEAVRFRAFRISRPDIAACSETAALVVTLLGLGLVVATGGGAGWSLAAWACGGATGFAVGSHRLRLPRPSVVVGLNWYRQHRDLIIPGSGEVALQSGVPYVLNFVILGLGGSTALAGYRLIQLVFAPLGNLAAGVNATLLPRIVNTRSAGVAIRREIIQTGLLTVLSLGLVAIILLLPQGWGEALMGHTWSAMLPFLWAAAVHGWINALLVSLFALMRLMHLAAASWWFRVGTSTLEIGFAALAVHTGNPVVVAWAIAIPAVLAYLGRGGLVWSRLLRARRRGGRIPADRWSDRRGRRKLRRGHR